MMKKHNNILPIALTALLLVPACTREDSTRPDKF